MLMMFAVVFAAAAVLIGVYFKTIPMALLPALMVVHMSVNATRVVAYGRGCAAEKGHQPCNDPPAVKGGQEE